MVGPNHLTKRKLCSQGDPICSEGRDRSAHSNYELPPYPGQSAVFIAGLVCG